MKHDVQQSYGSLSLSAERRQRLQDLFEGWQRNKPADPERLAEDIDRACAWGELEKQLCETDVTAGEYRAAVSRYRDCLERAREALHQLPPTTNEVMASNAVVYRDPLGRIGGELAFQAGLAGPDDVLRLLSDLADDYLERHAPEPGKRQRHDLVMIRAVARVCEAHGVAVGAPDRGHFPAIIAELIPTKADPRDLIRQAFKLGKYAADN